MFLEHREHVAITNLSPSKLNAAIAQREFQSQIAHDSANHGPLERTFVSSGRSDDIKQLIAIQQGPALINHDQTVAVAIKRDAGMRAGTRDHQLQQAGRGRTTAFVNVAAVR